MRTTIAHGKSRYQQKDSTLWGFASTWEMRLTGPIPRPERTITHRSATFENVVIDGDNAAIDVILLTKDNDFRGYRFVLSRQIVGSCVGCWMTDSVAPFPVEMS